MIRSIVLAIAAAAALYHLYVAGVAPFTALIQRPVHLALMASLGFLGLGVRGARGIYRKPGAVDDPEGGFPVRHVVSLLLLVGTVLSCAYLVSENEALVSRSASPTTLDLIAAGITVVAVLELARRATGWGIVAVAILSIGYALAGPHLPGILAHRGYGPQRLLEQLYLSTEGIWGIPLGVSADFVYLFVLFGAVLDRAGGGALLIALADKVAGRTKGGAREDRRGCQRVHGLSLRKRGGQRGDHRHLHHSAHAPGGVPSLLRGRHRGGGEHGRAAHAPGDGGRARSSWRPGPTSPTRPSRWRRPFRPFCTTWRSSPPSTSRPSRRGWSRWWTRTVRRS